MSDTPTWAELRDQTKKTIRDILTKGISHSAEGRSMTRVDLPSLREFLREATIEAAKEDRGGITIRAGTPVDG